MKEKKIIIGVMCALICIMGVAYAAFATNLVINGTASIESTWSVVFTKIEEVSKTSGVTITEVPTASGTTATFNVDLKSPGDKIEYQITVSNQGSLDAIIDDIVASELGSDAIKFSISGISKGDKLAKSASTTFNIVIEYNNNITSQPSITDNTLTISVNYVQDTGQSITPSDPIITTSKYLSNQILKDNTAYADNVASPYVTSSTGINFGAKSSDTNGKGLYYTTNNTEDNKTTYYFRGAVKNNYVSFAGITWRIVRINEDGSIRLITQDSVGDSAFNSNIDDNAYVGYMYGTAGSSTYADTHANTNNSTIKTYLDTWYQNNLASYSSYLADAGFCNDRSVASTAGSWYSEDTALGYGTNRTYYGAYNRLINLNQPQYACPQSNDLFTTSSSGKGNKALTNPIGLITVDEVVYAGGKNNINNQNYYLVNGSDFWTMSPRAFSGGEARAWNVDGGGYVYIVAASGAIGVRPTINLKSNVEITIGDGTEKRPYTIKVN